ncbi:MAG: hypothetical protein JNL58_14940, partial [Planctomyces sp.]|nr:hypothetical protein [Planctomyces sp.]
SIVPVKTIQHNGIVYFANRNYERIQRYDLSSQSWLSAVELEGSPGAITAFHVDSDGYYVAYTDSVYRYALDGSSRFHLLTTEYPVTEIHSDQLFLFINSSFRSLSQIAVIEKLNSRFISQTGQYSFVAYQTEIVPSRRRFIGPQSVSTSPAHLYFNYNERGIFKEIGEGPSRQFDFSFRVWIFPDEGRFVDDNGIVYSTDTLSYAASLGTRIQSIAFDHDETPIVSIGGTLTSYTPSLLPKATAILPYSPSEIFVSGESIVAFIVQDGTASGFRTELVPLSEFKPPQPGRVVNPNGLSFVPDDIEISARGEVLMLSAANQSLLVWDTTTQRYTRSIPLIGQPDHMAYSSESNHVYLAYRNGLIRRFNLNDSAPIEEPFAVLASAPAGLATAGSLLFTVDFSGDWETLSTFDINGQLKSRKALYQSGKEYVWSAANQKMYFASATYDPRELHSLEINTEEMRYPNLGFGETGETAEPSLSSPAATHFPLRVSPDGAIVVIGSGYFLNAQTLNTNLTLQVPAFVDAAWFGQMFFTITAAGASTRITSFDEENMARRDQLDLAGTPVMLRSIPNGLVAMTRQSSGIPRLTVLRNTSEFVVPPMTLTAFASDTVETLAPTFRWKPLPGAVSYDIWIDDLTTGRQGWHRATSNETNYLLTSLTSAGRQRIWIRGRLADGTYSKWGTPYSFSVDTISIRPVSHFLVNELPEIQWNGNLNASSWEIWISDLSQGQRIIYSVTQSPLYRFTDTLPAGRYAVWVRSRYADSSFGNWSEVETFGVLHPATAIHESGESTTSNRPTWTWNPVFKAETYEIQVESVSTGTIEYRASGVLDAQHTATRDLTAGQKRIWVRAYRRGIPISSWGDGQSFLVMLPPGIRVGTSSIQFSAVNDATGFDYFLFSQQSNAEVASLINTRNQIWSPSEMLSPGQYEIRARSRFAGERFSQLRITRFEVFHPEVPVLISSPSTADATPVIRWREPAGNVAYELQVTNTVTGRLLYRAEGLAGSQHRVAEALPSGKYRVWIRATFSDGTRSLWGTGQVIDIGTAPILSYASRQLQWQPIADATHYEIWIDYTGGQGPAKNRIILQTVYSPTSYKLPSHLPPGRYSAWVRAIRSEAGEQYRGLWSHTVEFQLTSDSFNPESSGVDSLLIDVLQTRAENGPAPSDRTSRRNMQPVPAETDLLTPDLFSPAIRTSGQFDADIIIEEVLDILMFSSLPDSPEPLRSSVDS